MGKDSFAIHTSYEELTNMPAPFIVHGVTNVDLFLFITKATAESVQIIDEKGKEESIKKKILKKCGTATFSLLIICREKSTYHQKVNLTSLSN